MIADGHHRFAAARAHDQAIGGHGSVLALLTPMGAGGLRLQAIHRVVPDLDLDAALVSAAAGFQVTDRTPADGDVRRVVEDWTARRGEVRTAD